MPENTPSLRKIAELARLDLTDEELATFEQQLGPVLAHIDALSAINVEGIEPTAHPTPIFDVLRPDTPITGAGPDMILKNAPDSAQGQVRVPKVVDAS